MLHFGFAVIRNRTHHVNSSALVEIDFAKTECEAQLSRISPEPLTFGVGNFIRQSLFRQSALIWQRTI